MRYGGHHNSPKGYGFYGSYILLLILIIIIIVLILYIININNKKKSEPFFINLLDILKEKYALGKISFDEYMRKKSVVENIHYSNPFTLVLLQRYVKGDIDSKDFFYMKNQIENNISLDALNEQLVKGEITLDEYKTKVNNSKKSQHKIN